MKATDPKASPASLPAHLLPAVLACVITLGVTNATGAEPDAIAPGEDTDVGTRDPYFQEAQYYAELSDPLSALAHLQADRRLHRLQADLGAVDLELGKLYGAYNMPQMSADSYARVMGHGATATKRSEAAFRLAQYYYQRGDYTRASSAMAQTASGLPYQLEVQKPLLQSLILIESGNNGEAVDIISKSQATPLLYDDYTRYNLGVAQLRLGKMLIGAGFLESVGVMKAETEDQQSLRDQANLALGYSFLRADQGATARPLLKRVRLNGPFSDLALLGAGWAELAPNGKRQQNLYLSPIGCKEDPARVLPQIPILHRPARDACDREKGFMQRVYFESDWGGKTEEERFRRALTSWLELTKRSPAGDPAVQEAKLAVPYAYSRLKNHDSAIQYYRAAVNAYEDERTALNRLIEVVRNSPINTSANISGTNTAWQSAVWDLPRPADARYLEQLFAGYSLKAALEDYRDLAQLVKNLDNSSVRLQAVSEYVRVARAGEVQTASAETTTQAPVSPESPRPVLDYGLDNTLLLGTAPAPNNAPIATDAPVATRHRVSNVSERYASLENHLAGLKKNARTAMTAQEQAVRQLALAELDAHRQRLETYLSQARFSLARQLDPAIGEAHP